jgi:DUF971 family protein
MPLAAPTEIHAPRGASTVEIVWSDGERTRYTNRLLRGLCPCARCQGHTGQTRFVDGDHSQLVDIEEVGDYALRFAWPDCTTGLYSYTYLRAIADVDEATLVAGELVDIAR